MLWIILPNSYWKLPGWLVALDDAEGDDDDVADADDDDGEWPLPVYVILQIHIETRF